MYQYCGSRGGRHAGMPTDSESIFGKTLKRKQENDFQTHQTFHPRPTQKRPQIDLFSPGKSSPKRMKFAPKKPKMTFLDQNATTIRVLRCQVQDKTTRDEIDSYVRWFTSGRPDSWSAGHRGQVYSLTHARIILASLARVRRWRMSYKRSDRKYAVKKSQLYNE